MRAARMLRYARRRAGLTQRQLAAAAGVPQPTIARIERGRADPRVETLDRLLRACGMTLELDVARGEGVDRTLIRESLALGQPERARLVESADASLEGLVAAARPRAVRDRG
jgi:transcriptional regulator with XRE-family HTH domain